MYQLIPQHDLSEKLVLKPRRVFWAWPTCIILLILNLLLSAKVYVIQTQGQCIRPELTYSPTKANNVHKYVKQRLHRNLEDNPFVGEPSPELDESWAHLLEPIVIRLTPSEFSSASLSDPTLSLADGSGHLVEMAVYHELHCIKRLRQHIYLATYHPNFTASELKREHFHVEHCLEYLREAAMCRGDATLTTMFWRDGKPTSRSYSDHECAKWEDLDGWARGRMMDLDGQGLEKIEQDGRWDLISNEMGATFRGGTE